MEQGTNISLSQQQQQIQTLSPQQLLVVKLLELPVVELEDTVNAEIIDNPALEEGKEGEEEQTVAEEKEDEAEYDAEDDYSTEDDIPDYKLQDNNKSRDEKAKEIPFSDTVSFYDYLLEQLSERDISEKEEAIVEYLIGSLNEDGRLEKSLEALIDDLAIYHGLEADIEEMNKALKVLQDFDPAGIGARDLKECLLIQVKRKQNGEESEEERKEIDLEQKILQECFDEFTKKRWDKIATMLGMNEDVVKEAIDEICHLNPRPGASLGEVLGRNMQQIVPDFIVETYDNGTINLNLNSREVPPLRVSRYFKTMLEEHKKNPENQTKESKDAMMFLKQKVDSAQNFINAIRQRQNTLLTTMKAIIEWQKEFFMDGDETTLRPMRLRDIAETTGLDISTISRVNNSKYVQTNYGIFSLKYFFNDGYVTEDGEELSVRQIKIALAEVVEQENKEKPYTDDELKEILTEKGYPVARRTIAKYRQQMNIPVSRMRKE